MPGAMGQVLIASKEMYGTLTAVTLIRTALVMAGRSLVPFLGGRTVRPVSNIFYKTLNWLAVSLEF